MDFWLRHEWLEGMLTRRLDSLAANYSVISPVVAADPMMLFTFMMAQATVINLSNIALEASMGGSVESHFEYSMMLAESQRRALDAAKEIATLVKAHDHIGYFKVGYWDGTSSTAKATPTDDRRYRLTSSSPRPSSWEHHVFKSRNIEFKGRQVRLEWARWPRYQPCFM